MASSYPGAPDTFTDMSTSLNGPPTHSSVHGKVHDALEAIQAELGTDPAGASATVKARLDALDSTVSTNASTAASDTAALATVVAALPRGVVARTSLTALNQSPPNSATTDLTGLTVTFTATAGRRYRISLTVPAIVGGADGTVALRKGTTVMCAGQYLGDSKNKEVRVWAEDVPGAGSVTYKGTAYTGSVSTGFYSSTDNPAFIIVEDIGAV